MFNALHLFIIELPGCFFHSRAVPAFLLLLMSTLIFGCAASTDNNSDDHDEPDAAADTDTSSFPSRNRVFLGPKCRCGLYARFETQ
jgi:hypothetical protein